MTKIRSPFGVFLDLLEPLFWRSLRFLLRSELEELKLGHCRFVGTQSFVSLAKEAADEILTLDPFLHEKLLSSKITYISLPRGLEYKWGHNRRYCIEGWLVQNGIDGLLFGIVAYLYQDDFKGEYGRFKLRFVRSSSYVLKSLESAIDWLRKHQFSEESIEVLERIWYKRMFDGEKAGPGEGSVTERLLPKSKRTKF